MKNCLCGNSIKDSILLTDKIRFDQKGKILKCNKCSLVFLDQNSVKFSEEFYKKEYHQTYLTHIEPDALDPKKYFDKMVKVTKIWSDKFSEKLNGNEVILDVGCSTGHFIKNIEKKAKKVFGHELSEKEVNFCKKELNLDVDNIPLHKRFKENSFDFITMIFVLEHISDPITFLNYLKKFLKPGGKFIILVPNVNDALLNFYDIPDFRNFYYCIEHLFYYSPKTIRDLFLKSGLDSTIEVIQEYPITNHINWGFKKKPSDVQKSREGIPDILLSNSELNKEWEDLWKNFSNTYKNFLIKNNFGDRIWCEVSIKD